jgi:hypothetical protein
MDNRIEIQSMVLTVSGAEGGLRWEDGSLIMGWEFQFA